MEIITGVISRFLNRDTEQGNFFAAAEMETARGLETITVAGKSRSVREGDSFRAEGSMMSTPRGRKFVSKTFRTDLPITEAGALRWLKGLFKSAQHGIGPADIERLIATKGIGALSQAIQDPSIIIGISSDPTRFRGLILKDWESRTSARRAATMMEASGLPSDIVDKVLRALPDDAYGKIQNDPFIVAPIPDVGFANADKIGRQMGMGPSDRKRLEAAAAEVLRKVEGSGSTAAKLENFLTSLVETCRMSKEELQEFVLDASKTGAGWFRIFRLDSIKEDLSGIGVCTLDAWASENRIARLVAASLKNGPRKPLDKIETAVGALSADPRFSRFDAVQRLAVTMAISEPFSILTGGPGTGKSTVMEAIAYLYGRIGGAGGNLYLTAPTSMAAERLQETTKLETSTLQSLLGQKRPEQAGMPSTYVRNRYNMLPDGCMVAVDEASMVDACLMAGLMDAMPLNGRVLLVGDKDQLPSVGAGNILADLLAGRVGERRAIPSVALVKVYRQGEDSGIAFGAALMRDGKVPEMAPKETKGVSFLPCPDRDLVDRLEALVCDHLANLPGVDIMRDVAVLLPQAPGIAGINAVNRRLSFRFNPDGAQIPGIIANNEEKNKGVPLPRVGDRIMITETDKVKDEKDNEVKITNGEFGIITGTVQKDGRTCMVICTLKDKKFLLPTHLWRSHLGLAYALTVHKSQGSQYKHVVMGFAEEHKNMMERALVYTGWTRAQSRWHGFGSTNMFELAVNTWKGDSRLTILPLAIRSLGEEAFNTMGRPEWEIKVAHAAEGLKPVAVLKGNAPFKPVPLERPYKPIFQGDNLPPFLKAREKARINAAAAAAAASSPQTTKKFSFKKDMYRLGSLGRPVPIVNMHAQTYEDEDDDGYEP